MAVINASGGAGAAGHKLLWTLAFDDAANTITINATHTRFDGTAAAGNPQAAAITVERNNGQGLTLNLLTDGTIFDGAAANMLNTGPRTRTGVTLKVAGGRGQVLTFSTAYTPPDA
jgi:hypothetical protein